MGLNQKLWLQLPKEKLKFMRIERKSLHRDYVRLFRGDLGE